MITYHNISRPIIIWCSMILQSTSHDSVLFIIHICDILVSFWFHVSGILDVWKDPRSICVNLSAHKIALPRIWTLPGKEKNNIPQKTRSWSLEQMLHTTKQTLLFIQGQTKRCPYDFRFTSLSFPPPLPHTPPSSFYSSSFFSTVSCSCPSSYSLAVCFTCMFVLLTNSKNLTWFVFRFLN